MNIHILIKKFLPAFCCLLHLSLTTTTAQTGRFYSTEEGLSSSLINQLFQDSNGFVWAATEYGLNKFDGLHFSTYRHLPNDTTSIKNNYVHVLFEDSRRHLLVGCLNGLMRYDRATDTFREIPMMRDGRQVFPHVTQIKELHNGEVWMSTTGQGMFRMDEAAEKAVSVDDKLKHANYNFQLTFYEDSHYHIWIGTEGNGLIRYEPDTQKTSVFKFPAINDNYVSAIAEDRDGNLFVGTQKQGLSRYDREKEQFTPIPSTDGKSISVYSLQTVDGRLFVGTDGQGLKVYNPVSEQIESHMVNSAPFDFSEGKVHAILEDREKNLWLGLFQKGIVLLPRQEMPFEYYGRKSVYYNPIGQGCVMSIFQTRDSHLWVGTDNDGVFELNKDGRRLKHYRPDNSPRSIAATVMCIYEDSEGTLWIGSYTQGLARLNRQTGECDYPVLPVKNEKILSITEDKRKNLYFATLGSGFYQYNLQTDDLHHYESSKKESGDLKRNELANDWVNYLFCDSEGLIWLAHYQGVSCFNPASGSFLNFKQTNTLITDCVGFAIQEDHEGKIWAGTAEGLYCFDKQSGNVTVFTTKDGLPNNVICGICEDEKHNLWVSTYRGISQWDRKEGRFVNFYAGDGLQGNEFTHGAFFQNRTSGKVYFGGVNGITCFLPTSIGDLPEDTQVWITEFQIFDRPVHAQTLSGGKAVIEGAVEDAETFHLAHQDNTFSIVFSTLQYNNPGQTAYRYRIEELSPQWSATEPGVNRVTYNNLPPGSYTFHVQALSHGHLSDTRTIKIRIAPPWYMTWWAYGIYVLLAALLAFGVVNYILTRARHRREIMQREHAEQLNEAKLQFFINISHEIRTPMTLIINPLEKLLTDKKQAELHQTYLMIYRNAQRILRLINQLMDIRKLDKGQMFLKFRETDMVGFISDLMQTFDYLAREKHIRFTFEHEMPTLKVWIDLNNFDKIVMNILSNAFKYTPEEGEIRVTLSTGKDNSRKDALKEYVEITVADSGIGIDKNKIERIFERFYQIDNDVTQSNFGTGIGLHLSRSLVELHHGILFAENRKDAQGSRFVIRIPLGADHLRTDELEEAGNMQKTPGATPSFVPTRPDKTIIEETQDKVKEERKSVKAKTSQRILIVEDELEIRSYLKEELRSEYKVQTCGNGKEALKLIFEENPDLVISDVMMPEMDGMTLCRKIKQNTNINHIPVILLTAKNQPEDRLEGMGIGADAYMGKPFNTELLKSTITNLLNNRRLLRNKFSGTQQQEDKLEKVSLKSGDEKLMERIMKVVNEHLSDPDFNVDSLATEVGLSRVHIYRKLKELTNLSAREFIKNIRLQQAATLLKENNGLTVSEIAYATGFSNLSSFSFSFREKYGIAPTEYKEQNSGTA